MCSNSQDTVFQTVYSGGDTTTVSRVFHATTGAIRSNLVVYVRGSFAQRNNSGEASVELAIRYSDDGINWDAPSAFGPASTNADGWTYGTSFTDLTTGHGTRKLFAQLGAWVKNATGTDIEFVEVRTRFDFSDS